MSENKIESASRCKLRFNTNKGLLSTEDLWDLPLSELNILAKSLNKKLKDSAEEDFLNIVAKDDVDKLRFDITIHILTVKKSAQDAEENAAINKAKRDKLLALLDRKQDEGLLELTEDEIRERIKDLG